jgi:hypothetical protein
MNKERKQMYMLETANKSAEPFFLKVEPYEEQFGKDLAEFSIREILNFYKLICSPSVDFLNNINCQFRMYTAWCQSQNLLADNQNHYNEIDYKILMSCVNIGLMKDKIITRTKLLKLLTALAENPVDQFIPLAIFEGICGDQCKDLLSLTIKDAENGYCYIKSDVKVTMSYELQRYARLAAYEYMYYNSASIGKRKEFPLDKGDNHIIKKVITHGGQNEEVHYHTIQKKLRKMQDVLGVAGFTVKALKESGRIHLITETMKQYNCNIEEAIQKNADIERIYGVLQSYKAYAYKYSVAIGGE